MPLGHAPYVRPDRQRACANCFHSVPVPNAEGWVWCTFEAPKLGARIAESETKGLIGERLGEWPVIPTTMFCGRWRDGRRF